MSAFHNGLTPKMRPLPGRRSVLVSALDVGTSKVVCLIARLTPRDPNDVMKSRSHEVQVLGFGHTRAHGMKAGTVVDLDAAEHAVRHAVAAAERMAGAEVEAAIVSVSAGRPSSELYAATVHVQGPQVSQRDIQRVLAAGSHHSLRSGRTVLHSLPIGYSVDDNRGVRDPCGMLAQRLGIDMHVVTTDVAAARNLMLTVERGHLSVGAMAAAPYAAGLATLADDETDLGSAVVDMGAGTTTLAVFSEGHFVHVDGFAVGGHHVTMDLARGLSTRIADAERLKTLQGSVLSGSSDEREMITVPPVNEEADEAPHIVPRVMLVRIIKPRVEEILEMVRDRLKTSPLAANPRGRVVLTGGACQLNGLPDLAARILGRPVRIARPLGIGGLPVPARGPAFAVASGLLVYSQFAYLEHCEPRQTRQAMTGTDGYFARVGRWLRESF